MAGKRAAAKAHTRAKVLACARDLFASRGYEGTTVRDLSISMGMSTGAIFAHFSGKDALFRAAMEREPPISRVRDWLRRAACGSAQIFPAEAERILADLFGSEGAI